MIHEQALPRPLSARESVIRDSSGRVTDNDLVQAFLDGHEGAFYQIVSRYKDPIINFVNSMINDYDTAVDLAQETFIRVYQNAARYERKYQFSTWIYKIATNLAIDELRNRKRRGRFFFMNVFPNYERNAVPLEISDGKPGHDEALEGKELGRVLKQAISCLPQKYRTVFLLKEVQELSYPEIAGILSTSEGTIKSRLHRAKLLLREKLSSHLHSGVL
ncbi:MAG TPA: sigma-70 family RNA polymerase sigma factor [Acidobacteriota bacterium]|jgi:RNA polymerase sigma-70 factor (ECF subfamily)|nr:sigma-70 family RNA polymerase sigma factor [Acidobacteriota bacterium]